MEEWKLPLTCFKQCVSYVVPRCISLFGLDLNGMKETLQESSLKGFGYGKAVVLTNTVKLSVSILSILNKLQRCVYSVLSFLIRATQWWVEILQLWHDGTASIQLCPRWYTQLHDGTPLHFLGS